MKTITKAQQATLTPNQALDLLILGNQRFVHNLRFNRDLLKQVYETSKGQYPFAAVLSCIDSRAPAELIFDQGLGDIFSARIAGNVVNEDIIGSLEFACKVAGSKLIVVLGHSNCGAIKGACDHVELGHLTQLLQKIEPAIGKEKSHKKDRTGDNLSYVNDVAKLNVHHSIETILDQSSVIKELVDNESLKIVGAFYDITTGEVTFF